MGSFSHHNHEIHETKKKLQAGPIDHMMASHMLEGRIAGHHSRDQGGNVDTHLAAYTTTLTITICPTCHD